MRAEQAARVSGERIQLVRELDTSNLRGHEPFGFRDGISQPLVEGLSKKGPAATTLQFGEFVLGYPNEYGRLTDRALLDRAPEVGRNGTYLVFRQLRQDVRGFWRFLDGAARRPDGTPDPERRVRLAAKMVGRWPGGAPLALSPERDDPALAEANDFGYHDDDRRGRALSDRRARPARESRATRSTRSPARTSRWRSTAATGSCGAAASTDTQLTPDEALDETPPPSEQERGLHFICLNANIARQFEFVQGTWLNNPKFAGPLRRLRPARRPVRSRSAARSRFSPSPMRERLTNVPRFVSVRGGAYFFLPGLSAVRYLASR